MKTTLYLTRHGQTEWNQQEKMQGHLDSPLTEHGVQQAKWLQNRLRHIPFDAIYSSSSMRAVNTAEILAENLPLKVARLDSLREINMGIWEGMEVKYIRHYYPDQYNHFFNQPHVYRPVGNGETYEELQQRITPAIEAIINNHKGKQILIVTHRLTMKVIMGYFANKPLHAFGEMSDIQSTALCKVTMKGERKEIELYGDTSHYL